jgi:hypothetical protein
MEEGLRNAVIALSFFRGRHSRSPLYRNSKRKDNPTVSVYARSIQMARIYITKAREAGFRGSILERL